MTHGRRTVQKVSYFTQLQVFVLEAENKKLARALQREVGEEVPLAKVIDEGSDWKGRREAIIALKDTIRKLKEEAKVGVSGLCSQFGAAANRANRAATLLPSAVHAWPVATVAAQPNTATLHPRAHPSRRNMMRRAAT